MDEFNYEIKFTILEWLNCLENEEIEFSGLVCPEDGYIEIYLRVPKLKIHLPIKRIAYNGDEKWNGDDDALEEAVDLLKKLDIKYDKNK